MFMRKVFYIADTKTTLVRRKSDPGTDNFRGSSTSPASSLPNTTHQDHSTHTSSSSRIELESSPGSGTISSMAPLMAGRSTNGTASSNMVGAGGGALTSSNNLVRSAGGENMVVVSGGGSSSGSRSRINPTTSTTSMELWNPNPVTMSSSATSCIPERRAGHACVVVGRKLYIFGGACGNQYFQKGICFVLDTDAAPTVECEKEALVSTGVRAQLGGFFDNPQFMNRTC